MHRELPGVRAVGTDGHPLLHTDTSLVGGDYVVTYSGAALELGGFVLPAGTPVKVSGTPTPASIISHQAR